MTKSWRDFPIRYPGIFAVVVRIKKLRTKAAQLLVAFMVLEGFYNWEIPYDLHRPNAWVVAGLPLIILGTAFRLAACGTIRKKQTLATLGIYSLCRHPLYLGSILLGYGYCCLINDPKGFVLTTAYFVIFYPLTILWEELRIAEHYGDVHRDYVASTPLILPFGRFHPSAFSCQVALRNGGLLLLLINALFLSSIEVMSETMR